MQYQSSEPVGNKINGNLNTEIIIKYSTSDWLGYQLIYTWPYSITENDRTTRFVELKKNSTIHLLVPFSFFNEAANLSHKKQVGSNSFFGGVFLSVAAPPNKGPTRDTWSLHGSTCLMPNLGISLLHPHASSVIRNSSFLSFGTSITSWLQLAIRNQGARYSITVLEAEMFHF